MANRVTPVQAAKELGVRPQIVYGFIRSNRLRTYDNPAGKTQLVEIDSVRTLLIGVKHHREKDPISGLPVTREAGVSRGTILSTHGEIKGTRKRNPHRVVVVDEIVKGESSTLVYTRRAEDGAIGIIYETERLAEAIAKGKCTIESPEGLLGVLMFHFVHTERPDVAASLDMWAFNNGLLPVDMSEKEGELQTITVTPLDEPTATEQAEPEYNTPEF